MPYIELSKLKKDHYLYSNQRKKALLYFKDETPFDYIKEFIGLRSKLYAIKSVSKKNNIKEKVFNRDFKKSYLSFENYKILAFFSLHILQIRIFFKFCEMSSL